MTPARAELVSLAESCILGLWLGAALFFAAVVAPAAFHVLPTPGLAGALVGRLLPSLFIGGIAVAVLILLMELRWSRTHAWARRVGAVAMLLACAVAQFVVGGRIERLRGASDRPIATLSTDDPRRVAFGRLHALSVAALGVAMLAAAVAAVGAVGQTTRGPERGA